MAFESSFNLQEKRLAQAVRFADMLRLSLLARLEKPILWVALVLFGGFGAALVGEFLSEQAISLLLGATFLALGLFGVLFLVNRFGEWIIQSREQGMNFGLASALLHTKDNSSSQLLLTLLRENDLVQFAFSRALLPTPQIRELLAAGSNQDVSAEEIVKQAAQEAQSQNRERATEGDALVVLGRVNPILRRVLMEENLSVQDLRNLADWHESVQRQSRQRKKFWSKEHLRTYGSLGRNWTAGFSVTLDLLSRDLTEETRMLGFPKAVGHEEEMKMLERALAKEGTTNALLIGQPGSGKRSILLGLAARSALGESVGEINHKRILELDLSRLFSQSSDPEETERLLDRVFADVVAAGDIILVLPDLHTFVKGESAPGVLDISGVLSSYLQATAFRFVGTTTYEGLHRHMEQNSGLLSLFEKVEVREISEKETLEVLRRRVPSFEAKYKRAISYPALRDIVSLSSQYIQDSPLPRKAVNLLEECMAHVAQGKDRILLPSHVASIVSAKTQIPVGTIDGAEKDKLLNLEKLIHERLINQEEAVKGIATALRRVRSQVASRKGPMGSFLFLGPTGVGKTETAKALAEIYFGSESRMIRLDMSEFQNPQDISRLLGGAGEPGLLTTPVREDPFSLILLDELEKAHATILNLFLQVLDEGHVTDGMGRKVDFRHTIIIATSNAGYQLILKAIEGGEDLKDIKEDMLSFLFSEGIYRPEFLNRFTDIVLFRSLSKEHLLDIAHLMLKKLKKNLEGQGIEFVITKELKEKIVELGYNPTFGARHMKRVIQDNVENAFASALLQGDLKRGDKAEIQPQNFSVQVML